MQKIYFPNLNGLRFIAAFGVIVHHIEQYKLILHEPNRWHIPFFKTVGEVFVVLFFVLSGFLITYLLLDERAITHRIDVRSFYIRRIRKIWPLYYLLVLLGLFLFPLLPVFYFPGLSEALPHNFAQKIGLLLLILPNLVTTPIPAIYQTWSIGVEEQFYLVWPLLFKKIANPLLICLGVLGGYLFIKFGVLPLIGYVTNHPAWMVTVVRIWNKFSVDCMAIGGIAAIVLHRRNDKLLRCLFNRYVQITTYAVSGLMIVCGVNIPYLNFECYAILFAVLILNLAANPHSVLKLEFRPLHYLGKISYGLYMYHVVAISIAHYLTKQLQPGNDIMLYTLTILLTIALSSASYHWFESRFLRPKNRFASTTNEQPVTATAPIPLISS